MNRAGDWNCRCCNHLNFQRRDSCHRCGDPRFVDFSGGRGGSSPFGFITGPDVRPGDWYCALPNCSAHNFASRSICFKCGASKDDGGVSAAASAAYDADLSRFRAFSFGAASNRPGWKSGDWICARSDCNEHNFASRRECFKCNAPRDSNSGANGRQ